MLTGVGEYDLQQGTVSRDILTQEGGFKHWAATCMPPKRTKRNYVQCARVTFRYSDEPGTDLLGQGYKWS